MKVRATAPGFYGSYREIGDEFEVGNRETAEWFEPVKQKKQEEEVKQQDQDADTSKTGEGEQA